MCGILGSVNQSFDDSVLDLIRHRGPDDSGIEEFQVDPNSVTIGHRRLSIQDLSMAGHQPMVSSCGNYIISFNGEIYNHMDLRAKLPDTIQFRGHSDTETMLYYIKEFGIQSIRDFNGIFAFSLLDIAHKKLFLARDPMGVKPLYYARLDENRCVFSSEIRPIKSMLHTSQINEDALAILLRLRYNPSPDTLFQQIKKIHPGHYLEIDLNYKPITWRHTAYFNPCPKTIGKKTEHDLVKEYGQKLEEAVKRQLISDVELGILLSGGIDSAIIAALAKNHYQGNLRAYTIGFEGNYNENEIEQAAETACLLGLEHHFRKITFTDFLGIIKKSTRIVEEPSATTSIIPMYYLSELAARDVKVVLTGQGADEPLGGYTRYKSELIRNLIPPVFRNKILPVARFLRIKDENILRGAKAFGVENDINRFIVASEIFSNEEIMELISANDHLCYQRIRYFYDLLNCKDIHHSVERMMALDTRLNLADDLLNYTDKITMHFGLECRVPMLDLELVDFIESLPVHEKLRIGKGKLIHKKFARQFLPGRIVNRKKQSFVSPTCTWFKNEADVVRDILLKPGTEFSKVFHLKSVANIIDLHLKNYNKEKQIFLLLSIYYWLDNIEVS
jgi:asparagine synthase (glutamine-hydrolysing)